MKDLYYGLTLYHILCCVLHKMKFNDNSADIAISNITVNYESISQKIKESALFSNVYVLDDKINPIDTQEKMNSFEKKLPFKFSDCGNFFICADHFPLGQCLVENKISYNYFEDGAGQFSRTEQTIATMSDKKFQDVIRRYGLHGHNTCIKQRLIDFSSQLASYKIQNTDFDFSARKILQGLEEIQKEMIKRIFGFENILFDDDDSALFLPQHNVNMNSFTIEEQLYQSSLLLDFFAEDLPVSIKTHPNDIFTDYSKLGDDINIIDSKFPSELLLLANRKFKRGITAWSSSINSLSDILEEKVCFTCDIDKKYFHIYRYYTALKAIQTLGKNNLNIYVMGVDIPLLENLLTYCNEVKINFNKIFILKKDSSNLDVDDKTIVVIDDCFPGNLKENNDFIESVLKKAKKSPIVFLNSLNKNLFFNGQDYSVYQYMVCKTITKTPLYEVDIYSKINYDEERIWIYMEDENGMKKIEDVSFVKNLKFTKMLLSVDAEIENYQPTKREIYRSVKTLEGILQATQARLDEVLKEQKKMR